MSILSHNIYQNVRTRVLVLHAGQLLLVPPAGAEEAWRVPGGGLEPHESLADCAAREILEETGIAVRIAGVAFLREWIVPAYCQPPEQPEPGQPGYGFGLEVYCYAHPLAATPEPRPEHPGAPGAQWVPLAQVPALPLWPKELKALAASLAAGAQPHGVPSFIARLESPWAAPEPGAFV